MSKEEANVRHEADPLDMIGLGEPPEQPDEEVETPEVQPKEQIEEPPEPPEEEQVESSPYEEEYIKRGLDKRFGTSDVTKAFDYVGEADKYITTLEQERAELRRQIEEAKNRPQPKPEVNIDPEKFYNDPGEYLKQLRQEIKNEIQQDITSTRTALMSDVELMKAQMFMDNTKDFSNYMADMQRELSSHPELSSLPPSRAIQIVYKMAKASRIPDIVEDATKKSRGGNPNRTKAEASAGGNSTRNVELTPEKLASLPDAELLKLMKGGG